MCHLSFIKFTLAEYIEDIASVYLPKCSFAKILLLQTNFTKFTCIKGDKNVNLNKLHCLI